MAVQVPEDDVTDLYYADQPKVMSLILIDQYVVDDAQHARENEIQ